MLVDISMLEYSKWFMSVDISILEHSEQFVLLYMSYFTYVNCCMFINMC